jgi:two-component system invasion response regulator UvrY
MIKVLIADDHTVVRQGLKQILGETPDIVVAGEATNGQEALDKIRQEKWDAVLLDITMPVKNGLAVLREVRQERPDLPVLILSMHSEDQFAERVLKAGASGYLNKESTSEELVKAIRDIIAGKKYISPALARKLGLE